MLSTVTNAAHQRNVFSLVIVYACTKRLLGLSVPSAMLAVLDAWLCVLVPFFR